MLRRLFAWVLLVGFVLLVVNLVFFQFWGMQCLFIYVIVAVFFILTNGRKKFEPKKAVKKTGEENDVVADDENDKPEEL